MCEFEQFYCEVGAARSGTNLLGDLLSHHPLLAYWRRPKYIWRHGNAWKPDDCLSAADARPRVKRFIRKRFWRYMNERGKQRLLVCTQANALALDFVNAVFPEGRVIHIIRDGREVAARQNRAWQMPVRSGVESAILRRLPEIPLLDWPAYAGEYLGTLWRRLSRASYRYSVGPKIRNWKKLRRTMDSLEYSALTWRECVGAARRVGRSMPAGRYCEVRFEDLIMHPEQTISRLLAFMGLPPAPEVDDFAAQRVHQTMSGNWFRKLSPEDLGRIMPHLEGLLQEVGYI
ncbi:MAG: sulfotransferase [Planctomycetes bacterium]|nr:sulfotransferase [Planctomycetota bacterium]